MAVCRLVRLVVLLLLVAASAESQVTPGTSLRFNGTNGFVSVPHNTALNAFPLTITAWVKTLRNSTQADGIVSKYQDGSFNGYSLLLNNGTLYAFYSRLGGNQVFTAPLGINGGFIADGHWHHIAFVISQTGGQLFVDGNLIGSLGWTGTPGPPTGAEPLQIGRYFNYGNTFAGEIDEVTLWNRNLSASELNYLKHRRLGGTEDGLLGYWRFDEGSGNVANNTATNAFHGALSNAPVWVESHAAIALSPIAGSALKLDGVNDFVTVPHSADLNAYPFTASAWFRTTNGANVVQGLVTKSVDTGNAWSLIVQNGRLRGFYYRSFGNFAIDANPAAPVADGAWHHAALTVDDLGGKLYLDGALVGSSGWTGPLGAMTLTEPLQIGRYFNYGTPFAGAIDEVTVWNRALTASEILSMKNLPLAGSESNLVAYWRFDEATGTVATDATGLGHTGTLTNGATWTGSTAYLGDGSVHLVAAPSVPNFSSTYAISTAPGAIPALGQNHFAVVGRAFLRRFYDFGPAPASVVVETRREGGLQIAGTATPLAVLPNTVSNSFSMTAYNASTPQPLVSGSIASLNTAINLQPEVGLQLDSVNNLHESTVTLSHTEDGGAVISDGTETTDPARLLHFNGHVFFGNIDTIVTNILNTPTAGTNTPPTHVATQLQIAPGGAYLAIAPGFKFGGGAAFNVNLGANGFATNLNGSFSLANPTQFFETNGIRYRLPGAALSAAGMVATNLEAWFPAGFGMATSTNTRAMMPFASKANVALGPDLLPTTSTVNFGAGSYNATRLWFAEETKPVLIGAGLIMWRIPEGEFFIPGAQELQFVRQQEDDDLAAQRTNLVDQLPADRISNDGYYHSIAAVAGVPIFVRPDANGAALLTMQAALQPNEYRPHFPYLNRNLGGSVPISGGALTITDDLIDTNASYLSLSGPVPVPHARDCPPESGCTGGATIGPQVLSFTTTPGRFGGGELEFTPEGGLLAYGTVPPGNLTWGFVGGAEFAQRTSDVTDGAYYVSGTFLKADDFTGEQEAQRPARLLHTGYGSSNDVSYVERPGQANYADGFANYAGLNFRAPLQGRSVLAGTNTGLYPLTPRSKYYVRYGGVSGIHEAASFPAKLSLYGYAFTFQSYRLSYLDSANWESRTDGLIALPHPSAFNVEFERMKFLCRGNLDAAQLPATIGTKHLAYWNTDLKPMSLQFKPKTGNACSLTERYLVLGVETKLPLIPQALHTALAFKANGNLANVTTAVEGVDSRFPVPANLSLQGPGGSFYPLTTAAEGYFNNWETALRPDAGFYNLVGRVRVPFFRDVKVQLHITPTSPTTAQTAIMGGWPAEDGSGANRGWNIGAQNYFNTAKFDPNHDGWPAGATIGNYRNNSQDDTYHPRAQQNWIDVAFFDYPLAWDSLLHQFSGFAPATVVLPVIDVDSRLKQLTPGKVDFDFAQDLNVQLPRLKVLDFANDALNELNAPLDSLSAAIKAKLGAALNTSGLTSGFRSLQNALRENAEGFFRPVLDPALDPVVDNLYTALAAELAVSKANLLTKAPAIIGASSNGLQGAIMNLNGAASQANKVFGQLDRTFADVDDTLGLFLRVLEKDSGGNRHVVRGIIQKLAQDQGPALGFVSDLADPLVNDLLRELEPTLANIEGQMRELRTQFSQLRAQITGAAGDFASALNAANHSAATLQKYSDQAGAGVASLLAAGVGPAGDYFIADPARAKREIHERLFVAFLGSALPGSYQTTFRQFLSDKNFLVNQLTDVLFDQVNRTIRDALSSQIAGARDGLFKNLKGGGFMSGSLLSAKIRGAPTFEGDSLRRIHLDAAVKMNLPDEMNFTAYMDIKELTSSTTPISCIPPGAPAAEVVIGARDVPLDWLGVSSGEPLNLSLEARWTLQSGKVLGVGGLFEVKGKIGFKSCSINDFGATLAFGEIENYFAAKAGATVLILGIPVDFTVGIFAGQACSLDPLRFVDPEVEDVLIVNPATFSGVYLAFGGGLSLSEILFGTSSCFLDIRANVNNALYYQGGPRFGSIGGRQKFGVDVDLICIISASAEWGTAVRLDSAGKLTVQGQARLCGKIGACPFCLKACKTLKVTGIVTDGGIDYDVDF